VDFHLLWDLNWVRLVDWDLDLIWNLLDHLVGLWDFDFLLDGVWDLLDDFVRLGNVFLDVVWDLLDDIIRLWDEDFDGVGLVDWHLHLIRDLLDDFVRLGDFDGVFLVLLDRHWVLLDDIVWFWDINLDLIRNLMEDNCAALAIDFSSFHLFNHARDGYVTHKALWLASFDTFVFVSAHETPILPFPTLLGVQLSPNN
jgi:hypothetical protein